MKKYFKNSKLKINLVCKNENIDYNIDVFKDSYTIRFTEKGRWYNLLEEDAKEVIKRLGLIKLENNFKGCNYLTKQNLINYKKECIQKRDEAIFNVNYFENKICCIKDALENIK